MKILTTDSLAQLIAEQCNDISAADARTYIVQRLAGGESDYEWVFTSERTEDQLREAALSEVEMALSRTTITVSDVHFNANGTPHAFASDTLLAVVPKIRFKSCHFYTSTVGEHGVSSRFDFEDCTFHALWQQPLPEMSLSGSALYKACMFEQGISLTDGGLDVGYEALFSDCNIRQLTLKSVRLKHSRVFDNSLCGGATLGELSVQNCNIQTKFTLDNIKGISRITLNSSKFKDKFAMIACEIGALDIVNTNFKGLVDFYQTRFDSLKIKKSIFKDFVGFEQCTLGPADASSGVIEMRYVTFYSFMNFRQTRFNQPLDLRNTNRADQPNFLDCSFGEIARTHTDRETFRIIKQSS